MLAEIEKKITSLLADALATRRHLTVTQAPGPPAPDPPASNADGSGVAVVSVAEATPNPLFNREQFELSKNPMRSQRVLPLSFNATIDFAIKPRDAAGLTAGRNLLLD